MKWFRNLWRRVWSWLLKRPVPLKSIRIDELPDRLDPKYVYLVGEGVYLWFAALICPCGCGAILQMSLIPDGRPRWNAIEHEDGTVSLEPSVWRTKDCRSHFFLRRGNIFWCGSSESL